MRNPLNTSQGKGDDPRHDPKKYRKGWDEINWKKYRKRLMKILKKKRKKKC